MSETATCATDDRLMQMSVERYGEAIRAAYEEGYTQGTAHPRGTSVRFMRRALSVRFWGTIVQRLNAGRRADPAGGTP